MGKHRNRRTPPGDYAVGYRRPPAASRFQKGRSGNPSGRRKGVQSLRELLTNAIERRVTVEENGKARRMRMSEVIVQRLINAAARQDPKALALLFRMLDQAGAGQSHDVEISPLSVDDHAIIQNFLESHRTIAADEAGVSPADPEDPAKADENSEEEDAK